MIQAAGVAAPPIETDECGNNREGSIEPELFAEALVRKDLTRGQLADGKPGIPRYNRRCRPQHDVLLPVQHVCHARTGLRSGHVNRAGVQVALL